jgi:23S rRNA (adenine2030-N6)-methyltransferase
MNYRHAFHAGNFADVHKHVVLALVVRRLCEKPTPFRVLDTHAGAGCYDLSGAEAQRTGEWRHGIARLLQHRFTPEAAALLAQYRDVIARFGDTNEPKTYPGSPLLALTLLRPGDRLIACEAEEAAAAALVVNLGRDRRAKAIRIDGWTALLAYIPPRERRGVVFVDPPYEQPNEDLRLADALIAAHRKWPTGIYVAWYPIKDRSMAERVHARLEGAGIPKVLRSEIMAGTPTEPERLRGSGLVLINPPWRLDTDLATLLPEIAAAMGGGARAARLDWISTES